MNAAELPSALGDSARGAISAFVTALQSAMRENLLSVTLYGSAARDDFEPGRSDINVLIALERIDARTLRAMIAPVLEARRHGIAPFILSRSDLANAADMFPGKFMAIRADRRLLAGSDLLADLAVDRQRLKFRCQQELTNQLLQLRRRFLAQGGHGLAELLTAAIGSLIDTLRAALTLLGCDWLPRDQVIETAARKFAFDPAVLRELVAWRSSAQATALERQEALLDQLMETIGSISKQLERIDQVIG